MNILIDKLPTEFEGLKINTNFRSFILFELLMQDRTITKKEQIEISLDLFYEGQVFKTKEEIEKAIKGILWFYSLGDKKVKKSKGEAKNKQNTIYSYEYDAELIYSAFLSQYRLDLNEVDYLHWWKFKSLFEGLNEENQICKVMGYRSIDLSKIKDKEQKAYYRKLKRDFALPDNRTEEEKERDFAEAFW